MKNQSTQPVNKLQTAPNGIDEKKTKKIKDRRAFEKKIVCEMVDLYEKGNPNTINSEELEI